MRPGAGPVLLLLAALAPGCTADRPPVEQPRRYADHRGATTPDPQCALPVARRTGGWYCPRPPG